MALVSKKSTSGNSPVTQTATVRQTPKPEPQKEVAEAAAAKWAPGSVATAWAKPRATSAPAEPPLPNLPPVQFESKSGYDPTVAQAAASLSALVYEDPSVVTAFLKKQGFDKVQFIDVGSVDGQAVIASDGKKTVIAFRGTSSLKDWVTDAKAWRTPTGRREGAEIHAGFSNQFNQMWPRIEAAMKTMGLERQPLTLTGHSMGGALATLAADTAHKKGLNLSAVYTFGSPPVGNKAYAEHYDDVLKEKTFRYVHKGDIVTQTPGAHVGHLLYIDPEGQVQSPGRAKLVQEAVQMDTSAADTIVQNLRGGFSVSSRRVGRMADNAGEHLMGNYLRAVGRTA